MKKILVAGCGNIGNALQKVVECYHLDLEFVYIDIALNCSVEEYLKRDFDNSADVLINLTGSPSSKILQLCNKYGLDYIDTGIEVDNTIQGENILKSFDAFKNLKLNVKAIIGAGMNPGIVEVIYGKYKPDYYHSAIELEIDSADDSAPGAIFNTWSPLSFYSEFCVDSTFYYNEKIIPLEKKGSQIWMEESFWSVFYRFHLVPHEEILSMAQSSEKCLLSAFLYSPPSGLRDYFSSHSVRINKEMVSHIPVCHDITGGDCVGILLRNEERPEEPLCYYYNWADHQECYKKYGVNGTCWQVVCGVLTAIRIMDLLPQKKVYTMTEVADEYADIIIEYLKTLGFFIKREEFSSERELIRKLKEMQNDHVLF